MLGPALALLFEELDKRESNLTPYEALLHKELLAVKSEGQVALPESGTAKVGKPGKPGGSDREISPPSKFNAPKSAPATEVPDGENFRLEVALSTGGGVPQLQIGCKKVDCPNKKRK